MIISGGSRQNWRFFAKHLTNTKDNDRARLVEVRGLMTDNVYDSLHEMNDIASGSTVKNFFYHADINPREDEELTPEQWTQAVDTLEKNLGLEGQPRFVVEHEKAGRVHQHAIWLRVDTDSMTAIQDGWNFKKHQAASRELETAFGHEHVRDSAELGPDGKRAERRPKSWEKFRGGKTGIDPDDVKKEVTAIWNETGTGKEFRDGLQEKGYTLCEGERICILDPAGREHSLARRISGAKTADVRERLKDLEPGELPTIEEARETHPHRITEDRQKRLDKEFAPMRKAMEQTGEIPEIDGMQASGSWWERPPGSGTKKQRSPVANADAKKPEDWRSKVREKSTPKPEKESWGQYVKTSRQADREPEISH